MRSALNGILVLTLEQAVAAPYTSSRLADGGARVIKIERPEGDFARGYDTLANGECTFFVWLNRGKESLVVDIKNEKDAEFLHRIIAKADIFIQNLAPGSASRAGFDSKVLRERYTRLITCDISGYGDHGPYREMKAYDLLVQAESGLASVTGGPDAPGRVGISICDIACGVQAYAAILKALYEREKDGKGSGIVVSLFDSMADWMAAPILQSQYGGKPPPRIGFSHPIIAPYGIYEAKDGEAIVIAIQNDREWARFCKSVLERPELAIAKTFVKNVDRVANRDEMDKIINEVFQHLSRSALAERLNTSRIAYGALNSVDDVAHHPQLRRITVNTPSGPIDMAAPAARTLGDDLIPGPVPSIGEHTDAIRTEFHK